MAYLFARNMLLAHSRIRSLANAQALEHLLVLSKACAIAERPAVAHQAQALHCTHAQTLRGISTRAAWQFAHQSQTASEEQQAASQRQQETHNTDQSGSTESASAGANESASGSQQEAAGTSGQTDDQTAGKQTSGADRTAWKERLQHIVRVVWREVKEAVSPTEDQTSALRAPAAAEVVRDQEYSGSTAVVVGKQHENAWQRQWREVQEKLSGHPFFRRISGLRQNTVFQKGQEVAENIRERWETSDNPLVHKIQDMSDNMFSENEAARALREIRLRDPSFDLVKFLLRVKGDVVPVIQAYLTGNGSTLEQYCSPEMVERLMGIVRAMQAQDLYSDSTILDISEVELVDLKFLEDQPIVVVQFTCQQINCSRDKFGNVVDGAPDSVHRVYYYWALQQDEQGYTGKDGKLYPPRWVLKEMLVRGMHNLL